MSASSGRKRTRFAGRNRLLVTVVEPNVRVRYTESYSMNFTIVAFSMICWAAWGDHPSITYFGSTSVEPDCVIKPVRAANLLLAHRPDRTLREAIARFRRTP